ncbi:fluoride efflux transporter CrcB [Fictibacillus phosphorivorans]|uniref:fluoride efflux transporter CrcB n=1 Tax=Fictibacillus phosphorivorans TaxID=1221500 RepID=UPI0012C74151|nr:fluoride efflux transporter CrcB [Fictibacillus phosphorivorans]MQR96881.1 fluoride efflux transporter CrcB [Fictibacillus phosphorivorans]
MKILAVAWGGIVGALLRFWCGLFLFNPESSFPFPTFFVNVVGSFILGWFVIYGAKKIKNNNMILALQTGVIGSFTTFSTFNTEIVLLLEEQYYKTAILYFTTSAITGVIAIYLGMKVGSITRSKAGAEQ